MTKARSNILCWLATSPEPVPPDTLMTIAGIRSRQALHNEIHRARSLVRGKLSIRLRRSPGGERYEYGYEVEAPPEAPAPGPISRRRALRIAEDDGRLLRKLGAVRL